MTLFENVLEKTWAVSTVLLPLTMGIVLFLVAKRFFEGNWPTTRPPLKLIAMGALVAGGITSGILMDMSDWVLGLNNVPRGIVVCVGAPLALIAILAFGLFSDSILPHRYNLRRDIKEWEEQMEEARKKYEKYDE